MSTPHDPHGASYPSVHDYVGGYPQRPSLPRHNTPTSFQNMVTPSPPAPEELALPLSFDKAHQQHGIVVPDESVRVLPPSFDKPHQQHGIVGPDASVRVLPPSFDKPHQQHGIVVTDESMRVLPPPSNNDTNRESSYEHRAAHRNMSYDLSMQHERLMSVDSTRYEDSRLSENSPGRLETLHQRTESPQTSRQIGSFIKTLFQNCPRIYKT